MTDKFETDTTAQVEDFVKAKEQEHQDRIIRAQTAAQTLSTLMLGESIELGDSLTVLAVPGGWIFTQTHKAGITSTYVTGGTKTNHPPLTKPGSIIV